MDTVTIVTPSHPRLRAEEVADRLRRIDREVRASAQEDWTSLSLTRAQLKILVLLRQEGATTVGRLASHLGVKPASISVTAVRLVHQGLVSRADDPNDRRHVILALTHDGAVLIERLQEGRRTRLVLALQQLSPADLAVVARALDTLEQAILRLPGQEG